MNIKDLRKLIKECITDVIIENSKDFDEVQFMKRYNPQLWKQWLRTGEADLDDMMKAAGEAFKQTRGIPRPGSDTDPDMEFGKTNFPKGHGYPNKRFALRGDKWKDRIRIDYFSDVDYDVGSDYEQWADKLLIKKSGIPYYQSYNPANELPVYWRTQNRLSSDSSQNRKNALLDAAKIKRILNQHGIKDYNIKTGYSEEYEKEVQDFYKSNSGSSEDLEKYMLALTGVAYNNPYDEKNTIRTYNDGKHWDVLRPQIKSILDNHGITDYNLQNGTSKMYEKLVNVVQKYKPHPIQDITYPSYVSAYDTTRSFGGHEEGGWWYDSNEHLMSIKVKNKIQALKAAIMLFKEFSDQTDGIITIIAEKQPKGWEKMQKTPTYS